jgi:DNA-binding NtrC family response regulator
MSKKVLVVDDDKQICSLLETMISFIKPDWTVYSASDCSTAKALMEANSFNAVFCDYELPDGNGIKVLENSKNHIFKVGISGSHYLCDFQEKCDIFLPKPFSFDDIKRILEKDIE